MKYKPMSNRRKAKNANISFNLCPNCYSKLINVSGEVVCSGDKLEYWKLEAEKYVAMSTIEQAEYLLTIEDCDKFLDIVVDRDNISCGYSNRITPVTSSNSLRIPDPMAVSRLERQLGRSLTDEEQEEGYEFVLNNSTYTLPFCSFPDDI